MKISHMCETIAFATAFKVSPPSTELTGPQVFDALTSEGQDFSELVAIYDQAEVWLLADLPPVPIPPYQPVT